MIPKIEDGNNFGVSVQEETLAEIQSVESEAAAFFDQISRYFCSRAKIISKVECLLKLRIFNFDIIALFFFFSTLNLEFFFHKAH